MLRASDINLDVGCSPPVITQTRSSALPGSRGDPLYATLVILGCRTGMLQELQQYPGAIFTT
jgi:hypothetical protein